MPTRRRFNKAVGAAVGGSALVGTVSAKTDLADDTALSLNIDGMASDDGAVMVEGLSINLGTDGAADVSMDGCDVLGVDDSMASEFDIDNAIGSFLGGLLEGGQQLLADTVGALAGGSDSVFDDISLGAADAVSIVRCGLLLFRQVVVPLLTLV